MLNHPSLAELLPSGVFMINDDYNDRMVAIDPATGALVWQYGITGKPGTAPGKLTPPTASTCCCRTDPRRPTRRPDDKRPGTPTTGYVHQVVHVGTGRHAGPPGSTLAKAITLTKPQRLASESPTAGERGGRL